jgi:hypothetical protein
MDGKAEAGVAGQVAHPERSEGALPAKNDFEEEMGYYIRVLGTKSDHPDFDYLRNALAESSSTAVLKLETGTETNWEQLVLTHPNGPEIAILEYNSVISGGLGQEELEEFIAEVGHYQPRSAAQWLKAYLIQIKAIYAFQLLSGTDVKNGWSALHALQGAIWTKAGGVVQADSEGFTNEDGYNILWQFSDGVKGKWNMAVLENEKWIPFEMDLGSAEQRRAFFDGRVPPGARLL